MHRCVFVVLCWLLALSSCSHKEELSYELPYIPAQFPVPDSIRNMNASAKAQALLGKKMFYDRRLSKSDKFSCASCHLPQLAFAGGIDRNVGENQGRARRNTPALFNLWYYTSFFHDGGIPRLSEVALAPMDNSHELDLPIDTLVRKLWTLPDYTTAFQEVYQRPADPYTVTRALMWFQLSLISANSRFDQWYFDKKEVLTEQEKRGFQLFMDPKLQCQSCHPPPLFTDDQFHHTGHENKAEPDTGRARISMRVQDEGKFKTPSLRNLAFSAPYFHDGTMATIDQVLNHYQGGGNNHPNKDSRIRPLPLTAGQLSDLKAFLYALTDSVFVSHPTYRLDDYQD